MSTGTRLFQKGHIPCDILTGAGVQGEKRCYKPWGTEKSTQRVLGLPISQPLGPSYYSHSTTLTVTFIYSHC